MVVEYMWLALGALAVVLVIVYPLIVAVVRKEVEAAKPIEVLPFVQLHPHEVKSIALEVGFKLKTQPDGTEDLNPYVYEFARIIADRSADKSFSPPKPKHNPNL